MIVQVQIAGELVAQGGPFDDVAVFHEWLEDVDARHDLTARYLAGEFRELEVVTESSPRFVRAAGPPPPPSAPDDVHVAPG